MDARPPVLFCVAIALGVAACAGEEQSAPGPSANAPQSAIARDYLGGDPPSQPAPDSSDRPHEFNAVERWIADHLPWVPRGVGR